MTLQSDDPSESARDLLAAYGRLCRAPVGKDLPAMLLGNLHREVRTYTEPVEAWSSLTANSPIEGWLQFQSHQAAFRDGLPDPPAGWGAFLTAEAVCADGSALTLRRSPTAQWVLVISRHSAPGPLLCDEVAHLTHDRKLGSLRYRRYWRLDPDLGAVQHAACFVGFGAQEAA